MNEHCVKLVAQRPALAASGWDAYNARKRNPAEVLNPLKKRVESHLSAARIVRRIMCLS